MTPATVVSKYRLSATDVDVLVIDAEGYDMEVLKQIFNLDPPLLYPRILVFEHFLLTEVEKKGIIPMLDRFGYVCRLLDFSAMDTICEKEHGLELNSGGMGIISTVGNSLMTVNRFTQSSGLQCVVANLCAQILIESFSSEKFCDPVDFSFSDSKLGWKGDAQTGSSNAIASMEVLPWQHPENTAHNVCLLLSLLWDSCNELRQHSGTVWAGCAHRVVSKHPLFTAAFAPAA
jgi:hypothetical protein